MTPKDFEKEFDRVIGQCRATLLTKAKEYARGDRLHNFKKAAGLSGWTPEKVCFGFMMKHLVSVADIVNDLDGGTRASSAMLDEKVGDAINYLILLRALFHERPE